MAKRVELKITERNAGAIQRINDKQEYLRKLARAGITRAGLLWKFNQTGLTGIERDIQKCMGERERYAVFNAITYQENNPTTRGKSGSFSVIQEQFLGINTTDIRVMGEVLKLPHNPKARLKTFKKAYVDFKNKSKLIIHDPVGAAKVISKPQAPTQAPKQGIHATKDFIFYGIINSDYEAYIGRTENRNLLDPKIDMDRRQGEHQAAKGVVNSIFVSGGEMIELQAVQGITESQADVIEDAWIDTHLKIVTHVRNEKYNVAGRGFIHARQKNAPTTTDSKRQGPIWNNKVLTARDAMIAFGGRIMDTIKFLHDNPQIQPYSVHNTDTLKRHGLLPQCVGVTITRQRLEKYKRNIARGLPHNTDICDTWNGVYTPINIPPSEFK